MITIKTSKLKIVLATILVLLFSVCSLAFVGCGGDTNSDSSGESSNNTPKSGGLEPINYGETATVTFKDAYNKDFSKTITVDAGSTIAESGSEKTLPTPTHPSGHPFLYWALWVNGEETVFTKDTIIAYKNLPVQAVYNIQGSEPITKVTVTFYIATFSQPLVKSFNIEAGKSFSECGKSFPTTSTWDALANYKQRYSDFNGEWYSKLNGVETDFTVNTKVPTTSSILTLYPYPKVN